MFHEISIPLEMDFDFMRSVPGVFDVEHLAFDTFSALGQDGLQLKFCCWSVIVISR